MNTLKFPKTKRGANKQWRALLRAYKRNFMGGGSFGFDWPTMRLNSPETYDHLRAMRAAYEMLPN
jgi:hypothetical protein